MAAGHGAMTRSGPAKSGWCCGATTTGSTGWLRLSDHVTVHGIGALIEPTLIEPMYCGIACRCPVKPELMSINAEARRIASKLKI
jgi:hypothetical protein